MSKEMALALFRQLVALASLFAFASPRIKSAIALAMALADNWDAIWGIIKGTEAVRVRMAAPAPGTKDPFDLMFSSMEAEKAAANADTDVEEDN